MDDDKHQCKAEVMRKDTYRVSHTKGAKFKMHYDRSRCKRTANKDGFCSQHYKIKDYINVCRWADI